MSYFVVETELAERLVDDEDLYVHLFHMVEDVRHGHAINKAARKRALKRVEELIKECAR